MTKTFFAIIGYIAFLYWLLTLIDVITYGP